VRQLVDTPKRPDHHGGIETYIQYVDNISFVFSPKRPDHHGGIETAGEAVEALRALLTPKRPDHHGGIETAGRGRLQGAEPIGPKKT